MNEEISATGPPSTSQALLFVDQQQQEQFTPLIQASSSSLPSISNSPSLRYQSTLRTSPSMSRLTKSTTSQHQSLTNDIHSVTTTVLSTSENKEDDATLEQDRKRIKLESDISSCNDLAALKRRILEHKYMRLKSVKEKYSEHVAELYFLQSNMNMMEYPTWRKKPQTPEFINFVRAHRLDQSPLDELAISSKSHLNVALGTEVKIPGVGATPVAVSTRLPAAVAQLNQQGGVPIIPDSDQRCRPSLNSSVGNTDVGGINNSRNLANGTDQFSVKAKQEVYVMQRISELQREGLWSEKRLPKVQEPSRPKAHWDYLLEEMVWLAADFAQERKWKKAAAKKCARMVQKHFQDKAIAVQKAEKAQEAQLKRIAAFIAKEVKVFWSNVEKLVEFKQQTRLDEKRKKALDQQLSFIVDQTERYSKQLAVGLNQPNPSTSKANSLQSSRISSPHHSAASDHEFRPNESESDDETTIALAENTDQCAINEEISALKRESEMDLEDFLQQLPTDYLANRHTIELSDNSSNESDDGDKDFKVDEPSTDDEDTIMEQERKERGTNHKQEIKDLQADNDLTIEELMAKYNKTATQPMEVSDDEESTPDELESEKGKNSDKNSEVNDQGTSDDDTSSLLSGNENVDLKILFDEKVEDNDELLNDAAAIAESIQPKGNTLSSTSVVTPIPFLLKHSLREYQHIGLDWLVTMHDRKLNGILADEMGLGKTIQTIALLAHLACVKGNWGPHLIIVPSSVMLNWEMEFMKWCPGFKILVYYGSQKERKLKRIGWTKANAFHVCITSYKLVIQDHQSFRRKKWKYLILDEAQNIKNFKSQRWQLLLNFQTEQRLLLTGTPLQNNLMELWSLMHFLMPHVFQSHREFKEWFSNPMTGMIEGNSEYNESIIKRLHKVLRPFLLRRLKCEVEKQMPKKYEHIVMCRLSKRQRYLYDDFMSRTKTKETLASGNLLSVINILMQLRKVCNHPNLFETRPTISPFRMDKIIIRVPSLVCDLLDYNPMSHVDLYSLNLLLLELELCLTAYVSHKIKKTQTPRKLIEEIDAAADSPPICPRMEMRMRVRIRNDEVARRIATSTLENVKVGTSPVMKIDGSKLVAKFVKKSDQKILREQPMNIDTPSSINYTQQPSTNILHNRRKQLLRSVQHSNSKQLHELTQPLANALVDQLKHHSYSSPLVDNPEEEKFKQTNSEYYLAKIDQIRKERRKHVLEMLANFNKRKCSAQPILGSDLRTTLSNVDDFSMNPSTPFITASYVNCKKFIGKQWSLSKSLKTVQKRAKELEPLFNNFVLFVPAVCAPTPDIYITHQKPSKVNEEKIINDVIKSELGEKMQLLHPIVSAMSTQFPDPRLIQYDCGKLQTLNKLLRDLKSGNHRVLIFTQMTRMLDVLESFLNYHGHIYLRLDGTTRVEQRQVYMERFNNDKRIFAFILSTRSGGVGINLTGADTVIFYDSDWNPTMDAQAQDRCHRIGQTRDVHIYRLVSEKTIEENILKKANQKRLLGDLAIEGGNFTTAYFKSSTIQDLFSVDTTEDVSARLADVVDRDRERKDQFNKNLKENSDTEENITNVMSTTNVGMFESALATAEDDQDVEAAKMARDEEAAELNEFDENIPITEEGNNANQKDVEISKAEREIQVIINQLNPVEKYAMRFVEDTKETWTAIQLEAVEKEIEQQKREWEANRLAELQREEEERREKENEDNTMLTYSLEDSRNQIWISSNTGELMPMWCPPTPPQDDNDIYVDYSLGFLYETEVIPEHELPPIYTKKDCKRLRLESNFYSDGRRSVKMRKEDHFYAPRSLFDRPPPALAKMRRELQRNRGIFRSIQVPGLKTQISLKSLTEPEGMSEWSIYEDNAILSVIQNLQGLPLSLILISPGHTPNWDLVADIVNQSSRTYRSPKQCRYRYEAVIVPREEGKTIESPKKQKKNKSGLKNSPLKGAKTMRTSQLYSSDNNTSFTKYSRQKFDVIKATFLKKGPQPKQILVNPQFKNPKHAQLLADFGITSYDVPLKPQEIAAKRIERISKEKQKAAMHQSPDNMLQQTNPHQVHSPQPQTQMIQVQPGTPIQASTQSPMTPVPQLVVQQANTTSPVTTLMSTSAIQVSRGQPANMTNTAHTSQIVKAIVASGQQGQQLMQQITIADRSQSGTQPLTGQGNQILNPSSVSVVLSSPVSTVTTGPIPQPQIVSIQQGSVGIQSPTIVSQAQIMQSVASQSSQVVSVSSPSVATLTTQSLRTQRIVASGLQDIVLHQRQPGTQSSPTVVSVSSLTPSQLSAMRLSMSGTQQVSNVAVAKSIPVGTVVTSGKPGSSQIQFYRQPIRQQVKVVHANTGQPTGQTALVAGPGGLVTNIQGGIQVQGGTQKVQGIASAGVTTGGTQVQTVATVQMTPSQSRAQFVKPVNAGKQITRQISEGDMQAVMVKRPVVGQHKTQLMPQTQIFSSGVQVQQASTSTQGQIATLVKTSSGLATSIPLSQVKAGQIKTGNVNATQVRQIQLHQPTLLTQQRKTGKVTQIAQVGKTTSLPTQLIVQNAKNIPGTVTVQQIQPVFRHAQPGQTLQTSQIMLGKNVGRMIPVSVGPQSSTRQTIQVVTGSPGTSNLRAHQNFLQGAIKVSNASPQQAIITALQNPGQRSNQSPVRLQTSGSLVAVTVQQSPNSQQSQMQSVGTSGPLASEENQVPTGHHISTQGQAQQIGKSLSGPASFPGQQQGK
ncbi:helicase domino isoform X2 [Culicoides brevitarsis]|uniref:helicase domino isoform X2 n=1 Tax=Culicoides brevitarsis TaxID=469753 RepID=UPI00307BBB46